MQHTRHEEKKPEAAKSSAPTDMRDVPTPVPAQMDPEAKSSGKYVLRTEHLWADQHLLAGTEVGTDTPYVWPGPPTNQMDGLDDAGKKQVEELHERLYGDHPALNDPRIREFREVERQVGEAQRAQEKEAEPVSHQQAWEQGKEWKGPPHPYVAARAAGQPVPTAVMTKGGDASGSISMPTPKQDPADSDVQVRTARPLQDQMPKEGGAPSGGTQQPKG